MDNEITRRSALVDKYQTGRFGAPGDTAGIHFVERTNLTLTDLRGDPGDPQFVASARRALKCALPLEPNTSSSGTDCEVLWLGPDEWLLVTIAAARLPIDGGYMTDVSHGRAVVRVSGARTRDLFAKGCPLDLHPRVFAPRRCAQTHIAHVSVLLHLVDDAGTFDLYCARSYAAHTWHWLTEAASALGYSVANA